MEEKNTTENFKIYVSHHKIKNLQVKEIVVPQNVSLEIVNSYPLERSLQSEAINELVDRTPNWLKMKQEDQLQKIKILLTQESVVYYLNSKGMLADAEEYSSGIDEAGSIVIRAFKTRLSSKEKKIINKALRGKK